jgi:hypothetical protein
VEFGNAVGNAGEAECGQRVIEFLASDAGDFTNFIFGYSAEEGEVAQKGERMFFISCRLRCFS